MNLLALDINNSDLAKLYGVTKRQISKARRGSVKLPDLEVDEKILEPLLERRRVLVKRQRHDRLYERGLQALTRLYYLEQDRIALLGEGVDVYFRLVTALDQARLLLEIDPQDTDTAARAVLLDAELSSHLALLQPAMEDYKEFVNEIHIAKQALASHRQALGKNYPPKFVSLDKKTANQRKDLLDSYKQVTFLYGSFNDVGQSDLRLSSA